jgi:hypothetical protein
MMDIRVDIVEIEEVHQNTFVCGESLIARTNIRVFT